jgi:hypothetical protein
VTAQSSHPARSVGNREAECRGHHSTVPGARQQGGHMDTLPVCEVDRLGVGPVGLTLGTTDAGGGAGLALVVLPAVKVKWFDERQICALVLAFVHDAAAPDLVTCGHYRAGMCGRMPGACCAFQEDAGADVWRKAADWRLLPGGGAVHRDLWPVYGFAERAP